MRLKVQCASPAPVHIRLTAGQKWRKTWSGRWELNPRPLPPEGVAPAYHAISAGAIPSMQRVVGS